MALRMPIASPRPYNEPEPTPEPVERPYRFEHRIFWSDVDLAQIVYTGNIPNLGLKTIDAFWQDLVGADWATLNLDHGIATPFVHLAVDIKAPVTFRAPLVASLHVTHIGDSSLTFEIDGHQEAKLCFASRFVCVFVLAADFQKISIPPNIRQALERQAGTRNLSE